MKLFQAMTILILSIALVGCAVDNPALETEVQEANSSVYEVLIADYYNMVQFRLSEDVHMKLEQGEYYEISDTLEAAIPEEADYAWWCMFVEFPSGLTDPQITDFGYLLKDINADGQPELFWILSDGRILALFTVWDAKPVLLGAYWPRSRVSVTEDGHLLVLGSGGADSQRYQVLQIPSNGEANILAEFGQDVGQAYQITDGKKESITQQKLTELIETYFEVETMDFSKEIQPLSP